MGINEIFRLTILETKKKLKNGTKGCFVISENAQKVANFNNSIVNVYLNTSRFVSVHISFFHSYSYFHRAVWEIRCRVSGTEIKDFTLPWDFPHIPRQANNLAGKTFKGNLTRRQIKSKLL